ncbi:DUF4932 domain-containing protein [Clostridium thermarum]|uniref:DUF4932 domain-containing protein n=1 Tax=Clostridium thermarum TaxID=1716543 RepID=UPI0013D8AAED|nr:DUF4932 domain-containing protein [Clostridium thermarum]
MGMVTKKWLKYFVVSFSIFILITLGIYINKYNHRDISVNKFKSEVVLEPIKMNLNGINIMIDPRIELLSVIQFLSSYDEKYDLITNENFAYKDVINNYFSQYSNHQVIKTFDKMSSEGFSFDAPPTAMLYLSNPLKLFQVQELNNYLKKRSGGKEFEKFISQLREFAIESSFDKFYNDNKEVYKNILEENAKLLEGTSYIDDIEGYYDLKNSSYNIILAPLFHPGGFGPRVKNENGNYDVYSIQGPMSVKGNIPMFGDKDSFKYLVWHEFSHSFVNPLTEENINEINRYVQLFNPIADDMSKQAYSTWEICVNEHIVRAVTSRLTYIHQGKDEYEKVIAYEKAKGFIYIEEIVKKLEEFERDKDKYKDFKEFYPELIEVFIALSEEK